jgi:molybdopterin synthase catalytic subunit
MTDTIRSGIYEKGSFSLLNLLDQLKNCSEFHKVGGIGIFVGVVRGDTSSGEIVEKLELDAYKKLADEVLERICSDLRKTPGIVDVHILHFTGDFSIGEDLVYVIVAGAHRQDVFPILKEAVTRYKKEAPIFKKEYVSDEKGTMKSYWIGEEETSRSRKQ